MSKFFLGLEQEKKLQNTLLRRQEEEEEEKEKESMSNKEKKEEEIEKLCKEPIPKKQKEIEQLFKTLNKYKNYFAKEGLPKALVKMLNSKEKDVPQVFRQRANKFLSKFEVTEIVLDIKEKEVKKKGFTERISAALLLEDTKKRKQQLLYIEEELKQSWNDKDDKDDKDGKDQVDQIDKCRHRVNIHLLGCITERSPYMDYNEAVTRLCQEKEFMNDAQEKDLLCARIRKYIRDMIKQIAYTRSKGQDTQEEYNGLKKVASELESITEIPHKAVIEIDFFCAAEKVDSINSTDLLSRILNLLKLLLTDNNTNNSTNLYEDRLKEYYEIKNMLSESELQEETTERILLAQASQELGKQALLKNDPCKAEELLEQALSWAGPWPNEKSPLLLHLLCLCFQEKVRDKPCFSRFKSEIRAAVGKNLLLLKSVTPIQEIARAFILLQLGEYKAASEIVQELLPSAQYEGLLKIRALQEIIGVHRK